ncbi:MAG: thermonuclease family protein [Verrucomicrobiales bacterium]|nr:thermonuclease family protein [Verrucomicrobiales bacterium]
MGELMWRHRLQQSFFIAFILGAIVFALWWDERQGIQRTQEPPQKRAGYEQIEDAILHPNSNNDGDSFMMEHAGQTHEFRLYFVDCPEKRLHQYNGSRIDQQGKYFGGLGRQDTIEIGLEAKAFTEELLNTQRFTIQTRWHKVFDSGRFYAFILFEDGEYLSEKLVREGLCRIYTEGAPLPDGRRERDFEAHLRKLEKQAKAAHQGGWRR